MTRNVLTLILLTWGIWRAPNNASKLQMGFNSAFKALNSVGIDEFIKINRQLVLEKKLPVLVEEYFCLHCEYRN